MTIQPKKSMDASVDVTNYFAGGVRKREEMLAQPECSCSGSKCMSDCLADGCGPDPATIKTSSHYQDLNDQLDKDTGKGGG
jgi:hypothetical protein